MRSPPEIFRSIPFVRDLTGCQTFSRVADVILSDPDSFPAARAWCRLKWQEEHQQFRVVAGSRGHGPGTFEFAETAHAVEFKLKFG